MPDDPPQQKVIVICGPTGVGKTEWAVRLGSELSGEIVSADSMQIYRYMDIGTAKPTPEEMRQLPHHMIDIVDPDADFSAGQYARMAREKIDKLHERRILPLIVGGTGLYIKACLHGLFRERSVNDEVLKRLTREAEQNGAERLHGRLQACDPEAARRINPRDVFRIVRALEVYETTGKPLSVHQKAHQFTGSRYDALKLCLYTEREFLYDRINRRVDAMMAAGLVDEVRGLLAMGYAGDLKSMQAIGYRHVVSCLTGQWSWEEALGTLKRDTRRYAKRQLTWFRADPGIKWIDKTGGMDKIRSVIRRFVEA
ncbi:MAG: tRNA (adenosine(37)-N6)-dimethylallyltransferase MiaA [Thermodesulfobacteriota bacterium]|nr:tRNA (adenosine(37)-N6)-dimethylallyltransferase MiaA [Thermodesulfobacteriota bacterium]